MPVRKSSSILLRLIRAKRMVCALLYVLCSLQIGLALGDELTGNEPTHDEPPREKPNGLKALRKLDVFDLDAAKSMVDFRTEIMPLFSRFGCNAAECHGSATGRGDFQLSLFGGDPDRDYDSIVNQLSGRRINLQSPSKSLLIAKPTEMLAHGGGEVLEPDSKAAMRISKWIRSGAPKKSGIRVSGIKLNLNEFVVSKNKFDFSLTVSASTNVGPRDVTAETSFASSNPSALVVSDTGAIKSLKPGKYFVIVKYLQFVATVPVIHPYSFEKSPSDSAKGFPKEHLVDREIQKALNALGVKFPKSAPETVFVRRIYLDLTGKLPTRLQAQSYLNSKAPNKKSKLIEKLLSSDQFHHYWSFWLRNAIQFRVPRNDKDGAKGLNRWLRKSIEEDRSWATTARQLVVATGDTSKKPAANFHRFFVDARGEAESVANSFLGFRIGCANCHNHPLDRWTQEDYHGMAAIFATLKRGKVVVSFPEGKVIQPKTGKPAVPRIPGELDLLAGIVRRETFANWMVSSERFKHAAVNRVWKHLMGRGIVEPIDDFRSSNPPIDANLLGALSDYFEVKDFRFKPLLRLILMSDVYASEPSNSIASDYWACYQSKAIKPEVYYNICRQVLYADGDKSQNESLSLATNNLELVGTDEPLRLLKGCDPRGDCIAEGENGNEFGLREKLHLINGKFLNRWLVDSKNDWHRPVKTTDLEKALSEIYWRCFSRPMNGKETEFWKLQISRIKDNSNAKSNVHSRFLEDAIWSLINSTEFRSIR